ncbi:MAG: tryptophan--tRNA ligase [Egibacteraceae bacterium]
MPRVLSGIQPTGAVHLGNYVGAFSRWAREQEPEHYFFLADQHAITLPIDPRVLRGKTIDVACWLLAAGLDPDVCTLFVQSQVPEHTQLSWILECTATMGEVGRMTQFKEKGAGRDSVPVGLFTYPILQAADILLYQTDEVPVGEDQRQHVELARDIAQRFNHRYGATFTVPKPTFPKIGARIMDLQQAGKKMSKSAESMQGVLLLGEDEATTRKKVLRAVTDSGSEVRAGPEKVGITNLLGIMAAVTGSEVAALEHTYQGKGYGDFKSDVAEAVNAFLRPVRQRHAELVADPDAVRDVLLEGAGKAREVAARTVATSYERVGFLPPLP